ncbi:MAG: hypothetical protein NVSMB9_18880 [Isosphaeraceae bacterium]
MRRSLRNAVLASVLSTGLLSFGAARVQAQGYGGYYGPGYGGGGYGGGYGVPSYNYYGNGGHDTQPHMHVRRGLFGTSAYYGLGRHDFRPHGHTQTPYGITSHNGGVFSNTHSDSPPTPYGYRPW